MGRLLFGAILAVIGLLYIGAAVMALTPQKGFLAPSGIDATSIFSALLFLVVGAAAAVASINLLREKRR